MTLPVFTEALSVFLGIICCYFLLELLARYRKVEDAARLTYARQCQRCGADGKLCGEPGDYFVSCVICEICGPRVSDAMAAVRLWNRLEWIR
jgi:hypothetical protein